VISSFDNQQVDQEKKGGILKSIEFTTGAIIAGIIIFILVLGVLNYLNLLSLSQIFPNQLGFLPHKSTPVKTQGTPAIDFWTLSYPNIMMKNAVIKRTEQAKNNNDSNKRFDLYKQVFAYLAGMYASSHDPKTREAMQTLSQFIAKEFPKNYSDKIFQVPCLDASCGKAIYAKEISIIKDELNQNKKIDPVVRNSILKRFEAAAIASPNAKLGNYFVAFKELVSEEKSTRDSDLEAIALELKNFMKDNYPKEYQDIEKFDPKSLEL